MINFNQSIKMLTASLVLTQISVVSAKTPHTYLKKDQIQQKLITDPKTDTKYHVMTRLEVQAGKGRGCTKDGMISASLDKYKTSKNLADKPLWVTSRMHYFDGTSSTNNCAALFPTVTQVNEAKKLKKEERDKKRKGVEVKAPELNNFLAGLGGVKYKCSYTFEEGNADKIYMTKNRLKGIKCVAPIANNAGNICKFDQLAARLSKGVDEVLYKDTGNEVRLKVKFKRTRQSPAMYSMGTMNQRECFLTAQKN